MASISTEKILNFLKENHEEISRTELAEILGLSASSVNGALGGRYGLVAKGLVTERAEEITQPAVTEKEKAKKIVNRYVKITEEGKAFDFEAYELEQAEKRKMARKAKKQAQIEEEE